MTAAIAWTFSWIVAGGGHTVLGTVIGAAKYFIWVLFV